MYLQRATLENIACFDKLDLEFHDGSWRIILGDNGFGKTTILRCIALGLCTESGAAGLLQELYSDLVRDQTPGSQATISLELCVPDSSRRFQIKTRLKRNDAGDVEISQETTPKEQFPWDEIFVCGYGAARGGYATRDLDEYTPVDAVYSLFNYDAKLQNPELTLRRIAADSELKSNAILNGIARVLMLSPSSITLGRSGILAQGVGFSGLGIGSWGDGYRATLTWLADLFGWASMYDESATIDGLSGIVLLDELEQHLHPRWQRRILAALRETFPKLQLIASTHSPLCAIGTTDLSPETCELSVLTKREERIVHDVAAPPRDLRADQVLTSHFFGMLSTRSDNVTSDIARYSQLAAKSDRTPGEEAEFRQLRGRLDESIGSPETELQRIVYEAVKQALPGALERYASSVAPPLDALDFETRRQVRELLGLDD